MHLFYTPDISGNLYTLSEDESKHCTRVLRLKVGDTIHLTNGLGVLFQCVIENDHEKRCAIAVVKITENYEPRPYYLHIAIAPTKNTERLEWFLEKATEMGIDEISPIICEHSERKEINSARLEKVLVSAMKQSLKARLPKLNEAIKFTEFVKKPFNTAKFIAHCHNSERKSLPNVYTKGNLLALIGPEGDFSEKEVKMAEAQGFTCIGLGNSRLRTETAGIVVCSTAYLKNMQ